MKTYAVSLPLIGLISGTRAIAAGGLALLLADKLDANQRRAVGWTLFGVGLLYDDSACGKVVRVLRENSDSLRIITQYCRI